MSNNKKRNKEIRQRYEREQYMKEHPEECFSEPDVDYLNDTPIGQTESVDGFPYPNSKGYTQSVYRCKRCGKEHELALAY